MTANIAAALKADLAEYRYALARVGASAEDAAVVMESLAEAAYTAAEHNAYLRDNMDSPYYLPRARQAASMTERLECTYCGSPWHPDKFHPGCCAECGGPKRHVIERRNEPAPNEVWVLGETSFGRLGG